MKTVDMVVAAAFFVVALAVILTLTAPPTAAQCAAKTTLRTYELGEMVTHTINGDPARVVGWGSEHPRCGKDWINWYLVHFADGSEIYAIPELLE